MIRERTKAFPNIPLTVNGLSESLVIVGDVGTVQVRVSGPRSTVEDLVSTDMEAAIDLAKVTQPGTYSIKIHVPKPENAWSASATPQTISLNVEAQATATFPVETRISGDLGANQQVESVNPAVAEVSVNGPTSLVNTVDRVELPIDIANRTTDFASVFTPVAVTAGGQAVAGVS